MKFVFKHITTANYVKLNAADVSDITDATVFSAATVADIQSGNWLPFVALSDPAVYKLVLVNVSAA